MSGLPTTDLLDTLGMAITPKDWKRVLEWLERRIPQRDLPEAAARVLRENLWRLYD